LIMFLIAPPVVQFVQARDRLKRFAHLCAEQRQAKERVC
jgi:hypothetical protein